MEAYRHSLWECNEVKKIWQAFNEFMTYIKQQYERVQEYGNVLKIWNMGAVSK